MNSYPTEIKSIILASLLHDIGKFGQRAGAPRSEEMIPTYCPANRFGKPGYLHVLHADYFTTSIKNF